MNGPIVLCGGVERVNAPATERCKTPGCPRFRDRNVTHARGRCSICHNPPLLTDLVCDCLVAYPAAFGECARCRRPIVALMHETARERIYETLPGLRAQRIKEDA